ncbi:serine/threonine-protein kinase [Pyxidicoccus caerfyrddinensis]|uniref:serine/threonine-protein kinase n=1 Tax=Pyxidicoccus caerfyrddinensis TaxID=2709663 RepID=UPI003084284F
MVEQRGQGAYGAVYLAIGRAARGPVALKLSLHPGNERFTREVELLSRIRHPSVPRLVDHGSWQPAEGLAYPYFVMELIDGLSLYDWARVHGPTSRQVLRVLASLARALEATHAEGGVHRDVKGDNVLVREVDGQVFLTDFGSGHYAGAARLTWSAFPPGTPAYRTPEAWRSALNAAAPYAPGPADDVFALGITAWRLVTGEYPPATDPGNEASHIWRVDGPGPRPPRAINARCCAELSALVSRMLSVSPEARGSARELAEALEQAAHEAASEADVFLFAREKPRPVAPRSPPPPAVPRARARARRSWPRAASLGVTLAFGAGWLLSALTEKEPGMAQVSPTEDSKDGGTVAVGDSALTAPVALSPALSAWPSIALEVPPKPLPGQRRPDASGRCPSRLQVPINGGCWHRVVADTKECDTDSYAYKGACYVPVFLPTRVPTSRPVNRLDGR